MRLATIAYRAQCCMIILVMFLGEEYCKSAFCMCKKEIFYTHCFCAYVTYVNQLYYIGDRHKCELVKGESEACFLRVRSVSNEVRINILGLGGRINMLVAF